MKKILLGMAAAWLSLSVQADEIVLNDSHPDSHVVVKGDTLWDISETFLKSPWMWPEIWHANPQIDNPHLIYPGDVIRLIYIDGKPRLTVDRGETGRTYKLSPSMRIEPLGDAIPAIPLDAINSFLSRSRVVLNGELDEAPYVLVGAEKHLVLGAGDQLYARGDFTESSPVYGVYRKGKDFIDPETDEKLGTQALDIGSVKLETEENGIATFSVSRTTQEIRVGDRLLPNEERSIDSTFFPSAPDTDIEGVVIAVEGGLTQVGSMDVVAINRGDRDGLAIGNVLAIYKTGGKVRDRIAGDTVDLPDERAGLLMVFRTFERMSYALVLETTRPLSVEDKVRNP
ncbi:MAG: LysM peptidoglycan-binding domain-containing protein [Candidatus Pelagadaptatus aseana]|uniref:LysM peptidoglycan-binding domain-containing protein n=1 Tax=Candidatus Pelagadaptatus aseana TaxID=3120508 RepID=UPI0039B20B2B